MSTPDSTVIGTRGATAAPQDRNTSRLLLEPYECGPIAFAGNPGASHERRLVLDHVVRPERADARQRFEAVAGALRDVLSQR